MNYDKLIPKDSSLRLFMKVLSCTEVPVSYQIAIGLSTIGCIARRKYYIDQVNWKVYPTLRVLLVGPSGIGKDTCIDRAEETLQAAAPSIPIKGGKTFDYIAEELSDIKPPCVAYIPAYELTSFIGKASYQESMVQRLTDLLSDKSKMDISTLKNGEKYIFEPTITLQAGSTPEWLQKAMPEGSLEGGFFPRFLIVTEYYNSKNIPLVSYELSKLKRAEIEKNRDEWYEWCRDFNHNTIRLKSRRMLIFSDAADMYTNWYYNRRKYFAESVRPYAERSRDQVLRLAMLMALSRGKKWISIVDMEFGITFMNLIGKKIAEAVLPPSKEGQLADKILKILEKGSTTQSALSREFANQYTVRKVKDAIGALKFSKLVTEDEQTKELKRLK